MYDAAYLAQGSSCSAMAEDSSPTPSPFESLLQSCAIDPEVQDILRDFGVNTLVTCSVMSDEGVKAMAKKNVPISFA
jgi:hypothetical protein